MENAGKTQPWNWFIATRLNNTRLAVLAGLGLVVILGGLGALNPLLGVVCAMLVLAMAIALPRPAVIVYTLALTLPLMAGLTKIAAIPLLRLPQLLLVLGFVLFVFAKPTCLSKSRVTAMDLAIVIFVLSEDVFPVLALYYRGEQLNLNNSDVLQALLRPIQYYLLYRIVVAIITSEKQVKVLLKVLFVSSICVSVVGILEKLNVGPVRAILETYYPISISAGGYVASNLRIASTLGYYSGLGSYMGFTIIIALVCYITRGWLKISSHLLATTILLDTITLILTGTFSAWIGMAVGVVVVFLVSKHLPKEVFFALIGIVLAALIFQPFLSARFNEQLAPGAAQGLLPQSFAYRISFWTSQTLPQIRQHLFFGVGPAPANIFEDSMYIYLLLEGGLCFFLGYLLLMGVAIAVCWKQAKDKREDIGWVVAIAALAILVALNVMNVSEEYFTYIGGAQTLWILLAIVVANAQLKVSTGALH